VVAGAGSARGRGPGGGRRGRPGLTSEEETVASITLLLAWWSGISAAAEARLRAFMADRLGRLAAGAQGREGPT
jgi:hypothetical protein